MKDGILFTKDFALLAVPFCVGITFSAGFVIGELLIERVKQNVIKK